jgi:hypothetical protein
MPIKLSGFHGSGIALERRVYRSEGGKVLAVREVVIAAERGHGADQRCAVEPIAKFIRTRQLNSPFDPIL